MHLTIFWYVVLALVAYNGAVLGEIFRAGILSLDPGQTEAAYAVGLGYWQAMFLVVVPQAARRMIPAIVSQLVTLLKDTSLGFVITYEEFLRRGEITGEFCKNLLQTYIVVALLYIVVNFTLSQTARRLEVRQRSALLGGRDPRGRRGGSRRGRCPRGGRPLRVTSGSSGSIGADPSVRERLAEGVGGLGQRRVGGVDDASHAEEPVELTLVARHLDGHAGLLQAEPERLTLVAERVEPAVMMRAGARRPSSSTERVDR